MGDGPRRRRTNAWAWVYLVLFGPGDKRTDSEAESTDQSGETEFETSDGPETK